jgi:hypothetical protein
MIKHGFYLRLDIRAESGERFEPLRIQRWRCAEHGTMSFLPPFLATYQRYLAETVAKVCDKRLECGRVNFPAEVTGPTPDTARRWFAQLCVSTAIEQWLARCYLPPGSLNLEPHRPTRIVQLARALASHLNICPNYYPRLLQTARFAA